MNIVNTQGGSEKRRELGVGSWVIIALVSILLPPIMLLLLCVITRFPPQIFGRDIDHFRSFVIEPIPESVEIIDVEFDDVMFMNDSDYWFMFKVNEENLQQIISEQSMRPAIGHCYEPYDSPDWQYSAMTESMEKYEYRNEENTSILSLCYDPSNSIVIYVYFHN